MSKANAYRMPPITGDATKTIQNALETHGSILLPSGVIACQSYIHPISGGEIWLRRDTTLLKDFNSGSGPTGAFIRNRDLNITIEGFKIKGRGEISAAPGRSGGILGLNVNNLRVTGWKTTYWSTARHTLLIGDDCYIANVNWNIGDTTASSGSGGVRYEGGHNFLMEDSHVVSGDDVFQFVPSGALNDPFFNTPDITNGRYLNCTGQSYDGRLCVAGLQDQYDNGPINGMTSGVHDCSFEDISGYSGKSAFVHQNKSSTGSITGTRTKNVVISRKYAEHGQRGEVYMNGVAGTGGVDDIDLSGVTIIDHRETPGEHDHPIYAQDGLVTNIIKPANA